MIEFNLACATSCLAELLPAQPDRMLIVYSIRWVLLVQFMLENNEPPFQTTNTIYSTVKSELCLGVNTITARHARLRVSRRSWLTCHAPRDVRHCQSLTVRLMSRSSGTAQRPARPATTRRSRGAGLCALPSRGCAQHGRPPWLRGSGGSGGKT